MTNQIEFYQGDSSDIIKIAVFSEGEQVIGDDLQDFSGTFKVMKKLGTTPLIEKSMTTVEDTFRSFIDPDESEELDVGNYIGVCEINNETETYRKETHIPITVRKQGFVIAP